VRGVGIPDAELQIAELDVGDVRLGAFALRPRGTVASREACDTWRAPRHLD
jgi:hypothetical protein